MKASALSAAITAELQETLASIDDAQVDLLAQKICTAKRVFLTGAGRSLLMIRACAMRLMQLGLTVYVPGEVVTPSIQKGDLLIVASGSGETATVALMAKKAKAIGAELALITIVPDSTIGRLADTVIPVDAASTKIAENKKESIQLGGSLFEISVLLLLEAVIMLVVEKKKIADPNKLLMENHANLE
ncbi:MAG: 6-phospho-3-hexuloisomerase [Clostridia bacterium]|nr:6-phospho-3-hexuloisomerase [Clostridia bacterium]